MFYRSVNLIFVRKGGWRLYMSLSMWARRMEKNHIRGHSQMMPAERGGMGVAHILTQKGRLCKEVFT